MTEQEGFSAIISKLRECAKKGYEAESFRATYRDIKGVDIDSVKATIGFSLVLEQIFAGTYLAAAYLSVAAKEDPSVRLDRFWMPFMDNNTDDIIGLRLKVGQALEFWHKTWQNQSLYWSLVKSSGSFVDDKIRAAQTWMTMLIGGSLMQDGSMENAGRLGMECLGPSLEFYHYLEHVLDDMYGRYTPPPPPPKKGFWESIFG